MSCAGPRRYWRKQERHPAVFLLKLALTSKKTKTPAGVPCPGDRGRAMLSTSTSSQGFVEDMDDVCLHRIKDLALQLYKVFRRKGHYFCEMVLLSYAKGFGWREEPGEPWSSDQRIKELQSSITCQTSCPSQKELLSTQANNHASVRNS